MRTPSPVLLASCCLAAATLLGAAASRAAPPSSASSQPGARMEASPTTRPRRWYGWHSLVGHLFMDAGMVAGLAGIHRVAPDAKVALVAPLHYGWIGHAGVSLAVHLSHGEERSVGASLGAFMGGAAAGSLVGLFVAWPAGQVKEGGAAPLYIVSGAAIAVHVAAILDVAVLSVERPPRPLRKAQGRTSSLAPFILPANGGTLAGIRWLVLIERAGAVAYGLARHRAIFDAFTGPKCEHGASRNGHA